MQPVKLPGALQGDGPLDTMPPPFDGRSTDQGAITLPRLVPVVARFVASITLISLVAACATETHQALEVQRPAAANSSAAVAATTEAVARQALALVLHGLGPAA